MKNFNHINVENLLNKVENFYKVFYINKLVVGIFSALGIILGVFLMFNAIFYFSSIPTWLRFSLFYGFVLGLVFTVFYWIILPLSKLFKLRNGINNEEIGQYIGTYFDEIGDSLVNTLQLQQLGSDSDLVQAVISQNSKRYESVDFKKAVPGVTTKRNFYLSIIPLLVLFLIWFGNPEIIVSGTNRLINYETDFSKIAPYNFKFKKYLEVFEGDNCTLSVVVEGEVVPEELWVFVGGQKFRMEKFQNKFLFGLNNVIVGGDFWFTDGKYISSKGVIEIVPNSEIKNLDVLVQFPRYTAKEELIISNPTVMKIAVGSHVSLSSTAFNFKYYEVRVNDSIISCGEGELMDCKFQVFKAVKVDYSVFSADSISMDELSFEIEIVKDEEPWVEVQTVLDKDGIVGFVGEVWDDYGISKVGAFVSIGDSSYYDVIEFDLGSNNFEIGYDFNYGLYSEEVKIQFFVKDNDFVSGNKESRSKLFVFNSISEDDRKAFNDSLTLSLKEALDKENDRFVQVKNDVFELREDLLEKNELSWSDKNELQRLMREMKSSNEELERISDDLKRSDRNSEKLESDENIKQREQLLNLVDQLKEKQNRDLLQELENLLKELDKDKLVNDLKAVEDNVNDLSKELERNIELFKQLEVEQVFSEVVDSLTFLRKDLENLRNDSLGLSNEKKFKEQLELEEKFDDIVEEIQRLDSLNQSMDEPFDLNTEEDLQLEIQKDMKEASDALNDGNAETGEKKQEEAEDKMDQLLEKLEESGSMDGASQESEDLEALRKILENLLELSFREEGIMINTGSLSYSDPLYNVLLKGQVGIKDDMVLVRDSLFELSYRVPEISGNIEKELYNINKNLDAAISEMNLRNRNQVRLVQQKSLTSMNNLAVLLDEIIQQMQNSQKSQKKGDGSCSKPGEGKPKPSLGNSKKKQDALAKEMERMKKSLEKGNSKGGQKPRELGSGMSEEVAKMAAEQGLIRDELRRMREQLQKDGKIGDAGALRELEDLLEENEDDIINLELDNEFFKRQQNIETKLLEAYNSELERELDNKRKSLSSKLDQVDFSQEWEKYLEDRKVELELLRKNGMRFSEYYKDMIFNFENMK